MTILLDQARWPWRGTTWCHLVSDSDLDELHAFAAKLGCRRVGFQGDHYDIDVDMRLEAIELGAVACDSRELVRRLRAAGLRLRPSSFAKWEMVEQWADLVSADVVLDSSLLPPGLRALATVHVSDVARRATTDAVLLSRGDSSALMLLGMGDPPVGSERGDLGVYRRVDRLGRWSIELVDPPLSSAS